MAISYINLFLKTTFVSFFVNDYLYQKYPEKYNEVLINISYKLLFLYSKSQILFNRINKDMITICNQFLSRNPNINNLIELVKSSYNYFVNKTGNKINNIEFISNGQVNFSVSREICMKDRNSFPIAYDFIIFSDVDKVTRDDMCVNKKIQKSIETNNFSYEISNISFILTEIIIGDKTFKVDFKTKDYNYYVVNNIFNDKFILYFLNKYYSYEIKDFQPETIKLFTLNVIDNNVDMHEFDKNINVQIQKDKYTK
jgi:hypothetical protein